MVAGKYLFASRQGCVRMEAYPHTRTVGFATLRLVNRVGAERVTDARLHSFSRTAIVPISLRVRFQGSSDYIVAHV